MSYRCNGATPDGTRENGGGTAGERWKGVACPGVAVSDGRACCGGQTSPPPLPGTSGTSGSKPSRHVGGIASVRSTSYYVDVPASSKLSRPMTTLLPAPRTRISAKARKQADASRLAVAVLRVSTDKQERSGLGLEAQRTAVADFCRREGLTLVAVYQDTASGALPPDRRPGMAQALADLDAYRAGVLVAAKGDRLGRSVRDLFALMDRSSRAAWCIRTADGVVDTSTVEGDLLAAVVMLVAEFERKLIASRTKDALQAKKARGERLGARIATPEATRQRIRALLAAGTTMQATAATLNAQGIPTATGRPWTWQNVQRVRNSLRLDEAATI